MSNRNRRYSKRELLGSLYVDYVMSVQDLGFAPEADRWEILREFLHVGEARAERLIEEPGGFLLLQSVPGQPDSGGIYVYNESLKAFFWLRFGKKDGTLNSRDFDYAVRIYHLLRFTVNANQDQRTGRRRRRSWAKRPDLPVHPVAIPNVSQIIPSSLPLPVDHAAEATRRYAVGT